MNSSDFKLQDSQNAEPFAGPEHRPRSLAELGMRQTVLEDLALKTLYLAGPISVLDLSLQMRLGFDLTNELFSRMRTDLLCHVTGMIGNIPAIAITSQGRARALELLSQNQYTGPAPVSLENYVTMVRRQSVRNMVVHRADVERAFAHLVIDSNTLSQFGTALNSGAAIFLHGPPGVGKSAAAETMARVLAEDAVWVPYAVEVDGQIIVVYDPVIHKRVEEPKLEMTDERWVRCHRPSVLVGGELTVEMMDLQFNPSTRFYVGPVQMKANNGALIIDDFGRQRLRPEELLNRWVVPLDRGIDFLTLAGGRKIEIPFEMLVVFATNINPETLVDAAFLRRIQTKIKLGACSDEQFHEIFRRVAAQQQLEVDPGVVDNLISVIRGTLNQELRACYPRDLVSQVCWAARFEDRKPCLDRAALMAAVGTYFLSS
jgi:predicted ATPase with chaperone activity